MSCWKSSSAIILNAFNIMQQRVLGIDYGTRRVGVAISDPLRLFARRLTTIHRKANDGGALVDQVLELVKQNDVDTIVVGLPSRTDGRESEIKNEASAFAESLQQASSCHVELFDERYTSVLAERVLVETNHKKRKDKGIVDQVAAEILLQDWLDREHGGLTAYLC